VPIVSISRKKLEELIGKKFPADELLRIIEDIGGDVEGYSEVVIYRCPECNGLNERLSHEELVKKCRICGYEGEKGFSEIGKDEVIRIELVPSRPDMFDAPGLSRIIKGFLGLEDGVPKYRIEEGDIKVYVDKGVENIRPWIVTAVVKDIRLTPWKLKSIMKLQENLHWALGRNRKRASIGVYDLNKITPPIYYKAVEKNGVKFVPLGAKKEMTPQEILQKHPKGIEFAHLLKDKYPLLMDSKGMVLSMPPVINSEDTRVKEDTKALFIDVTGISERDVKKTLNIIVASLGELGGSIEKTEVIYPDKKIQSPELLGEEKEIEINYVKKVLGFGISAEEIEKCLKKARFGVKRNKDRIKVKVPFFRADILHDIDIVEDIAIFYGYNKIKTSLPQTMTIGEERPLERFCGILRRVMIGLGFQEIMTLMLTNPEDHFIKLRIKNKKDYVEIKNPASQYQRILRTHLFSGMLETFAINKTKDMPQKFFEIGDVVVLNKEKETRTEDKRRLCIGIASAKTGYAEIRSYVDSLFREIEKKVMYEEETHPMFIEGRAARILMDKKVVGIIGEVHPQVLESFGLIHPVVLGEIYLETLFSKRSFISHSGES